MNEPGALCRRNLVSGASNRASAFSFIAKSGLDAAMRGGRVLVPGSQRDCVERYARLRECAKRTLLTVAVQMHPIV